MKSGLVVWIIMLADPSYANKRGAFALLLTQQFCAAKLQKIPHLQIYAEISTKNALFCVKV